MIEPPEGILREILPLVPLKSLLRFKCVSKLWCAIITSLHTPQNVILRRMVTNEKTGKIETRFSFFNYYDNTSLVHLPCFHSEFDRSQIHGHCHGTVCLSFSPGNDIFLYNSLAGNFRILPPSMALSPHDEHYNLGLVYVNKSIGFGYDPKSGGFKVVLIVAFSGKGSSEFNACRAQVYDLDKDRWREIKTSVPTWASKKPSFDVYYQGLYYWWSEDLINRTMTEIVMWFDMSKEIFGQIPFPQALNFRNHLNLSIRVSLGFLNGSMILLHYLYPRIENQNSLDVWGLNEKGNKVLWSKLFTIGPIFGINFPLAFVGCDVLLMEDYGGQLILYHFNTQESKYIPIQGHRSPYDIDDEILFDF